MNQWTLEEIEDRPPWSGVVMLTADERDALCKLVREKMRADGTLLENSCVGPQWKAPTED